MMMMMTTTTTTMATRDTRPSLKGPTAWVLTPSRVCLPQGLPGGGPAGGGAGGALCGDFLLHYTHHAHQVSRLYAAPSLLEMYPPCMPDLVIRGPRVADDDRLSPCSAGRSTR
jgi:hypothetical protein